MLKYIWEKKRNIIWIFHKSKRPLSKQIVPVNVHDGDKINEKNQKFINYLWMRSYISYDDCNKNRIILIILMSKGAIENDFYINKYFLGNGTYDKLLLGN